jgi:hypothetical protein
VLQFFKTLLSMLKTHKVDAMRKVAKGLHLMLVGMILGATQGSAWADVPGDTGPYDGWKILSDDYDDDHPLDILSFEWDYYTIVDTQAGFSAIIGYLLSNPRGRLSHIVQILPDGGNVAFVAQVGSGKPVAIYENFGLSNTQASSEERFLSSVNAQTGTYGKLEPIEEAGPEGEDGMLLRGKNASFEWDLLVIEEWSERVIDGPRAVPAHDAGIFSAELWTIDPLWHRTRILGTVVDRSNGATMNIDGHGYRENAYGRYHLATDGWDTLFFSEGPGDLAARGLPRDRGVSIINLTYHKSMVLDFADVSFYDGERLVAGRFRASDGEMRWHHPNWQWDNAAWQCVPVDGRWEYENDEYLIQVDVQVGLQNMGTLLSNLTVPVARYFINEVFPGYQGVITHKPTGRLVREFSGKGVGEFSFPKSLRLWPASTFACNLWGRSRFYGN